jgi:hypothetical protein
VLESVRRELGDEIEAVCAGSRPGPAECRAAIGQTNYDSKDARSGS